MSIFRRVHDWFLDRLADLRAPVPKDPLTEAQARAQAKRWWGSTYGDCLYRAGADRPYQVGVRALPLSTEPPLMLSEVYGASVVDWETAFAVAMSNGYGPPPGVK